MKIPLLPSLEGQKLPFEICLNSRKLAPSKVADPGRLSAPSRTSSAALSKGHHPVTDKGHCGPETVAIKKCLFGRPPAQPGLNGDGTEHSASLEWPAPPSISVE